jgi:predicted  nucleic acid-binding Zn-ribbon protein
VKRIILFLFLLCAPALPAIAQDKPKEAPAEVTINAEGVNKIEMARLIADNKALLANNLALQIQRAQDDLKRLSEEAERALSEFKAEKDRQAIKAGLPGDLLKEYEELPKNDKGEIVLRKKRTSPPAKP